MRCGRALPSRRDALLTAPPELHVVDDATAVFSLSAATTTIGRNPDNDIVADEGRVSRYHAQIVRVDAAYRIEDLDSLNGTFVNEVQLRGAQQTLNDGDIIRVGRWQMRFEVPRGLDMAGRTVMSDAGATMMATPDSGLHAGDPLAASSDRDQAMRPGQSSSAMEERPRRRSGWALKRMPTRAGEVRYILRNTRDDKFLELSERDRFIWDLLDGAHTMRDIVLAYAREYQQLALPRIQAFLQQLTAANLLAGTTQTQPTTTGARVRRALFNALMKLEVSVPGIDSFLTRLYNAGGWRFFTRFGIVFVWVLTVAGIAGFVRASSHHDLLSVGDAGVFGVIAAIVGYVGALSIHEMAHALATKSYGRSVRRGGLMITMAMPFAFVDTSSMWLEGRRARIIVSVAGPLATAAVGGAFALAAALIPGDAWPGVFYNVAFGLYMSTAFNLNPLIPLDGYLVLSDLLEMPSLREESTKYFRKGLWKDLRRRSRLRWGLALYGLISIVATVGFMGLGLYMWRSRLGGIVHDHVPHPFDSVVIAVGIAFVMFPVWFPLARRLVRLVRPREVVEAPDATDEPADAVS